jgi:hypothetical protein
MNKNPIEGRRDGVSWHNTAKPSGEVVPVNQAACEVIPLERHAAIAAIPMAIAKLRSLTEEGNQLKRSRTRRRNLIKLGANPNEVPWQAEAGKATGA